MATFVLVHGAGHGGWCFQKVARRLEGQGHLVYSPTLTGAGDRAHLVGPDTDLDTHIEDVTSTLFYEDLTDVVLVGHSYGGMVIKGTADRAGDRIEKLVFLDAPDGSSLVEGFPPILEARKNGRVIAGVELVGFPDEEWCRFIGIEDPVDIQWALPRLTAHPWKSLEQRLVLRDERALEAIPQFQVVASSSMELGVLSEELIAKARREGRFWEIEGGHDLMITEPVEVADVLVEIASSE